MPLSPPTQITVPFATSGLKNAIPANSNNTTGRAGYDQGFPSANMTPKTAGGIPPFGQDFNGILFELSTAIQYLEAGGTFPYSSTFSAATSGYPQGAIVASAAKTGLWLNTVSGNTSNPDTGGAGWVPITSKGIARFAVGGTFVVPPGVTTIYVSGCAGGSGGAGGGGATNTTGTGGGGAGGSAGQAIIRQAFTVTPGASIAITLGTAGTGGSNGGPVTGGGVGTAGGATVIGSLITLLGAPAANGGANWSGSGVPSGGSPNPGGFPSGGYGNDGAAGFNGGVGCGGSGASGPFGGGGGSGRAGTSGAGGYAAIGFGAGGGGGGGGYGTSSGGGNGGTGGAGSPGIVFIEW